MIWLRSLPLCSIAFVTACGATKAPGPDPTTASALERCIAGGGQLTETWSTDNQHGPVHSIAIHDTTILLGSEDGSVKSWSIDGGDVTYGRFTDSGPIVSALAVSADDDRLLGVDASGQLQEWQLSTSTPTHAAAVEEGPLGVVAADPDGATAIVAVGEEATEIRAVTRATGAVSDPLPTTLWGIGNVAFAGDDLFTAGNNYGNPSIERRPRAAITSAPAEVWTGKDLTGQVASLAFGEDVVVAAGQSFVGVFDPANLAAGPRAFASPLDHYPRGVVLLPGGQLFATAGDDGTLRVWNVADAKQVASVTIPPTVGIVGDADGNGVFTSGADGRVHEFSCVTP